MLDVLQRQKIYMSLEEAGGRKPTDIAAEDLHINYQRG
jgi:hypothetical protein